MFEDGVAPNSRLSDPGWSRLEPSGISNGCTSVRTSRSHRFKSSWRNCRRVSGSIREHVVRCHREMTTSGNKVTVNVCVCETDHLTHPRVSMVVVVHNFEDAHWQLEVQVLPTGGQETSLCSETRAHFPVLELKVAPRHAGSAWTNRHTLWAIEHHSW
jgi:hypothetical protein